MCLPRRRGGSGSRGSGLAFGRGVRAGARAGARVYLCGAVRPRSRCGPARDALPRGHRVLFALELDHEGTHRAQVQVTEVGARGGVREEGLGLLDELDVLLARLELHLVSLRFQSAPREFGQRRVRVQPRQRVSGVVQPRQRVSARSPASRVPTGVRAPRQREFGRRRVRVTAPARFPSHRARLEPSFADAALCVQSIQSRGRAPGSSSRMGFSAATDWLQVGAGEKRREGAGPMGSMRGGTSGNGSRRRTRRASSFLVRCLASARTSTRLSGVR